ENQWESAVALQDWLRSDEFEYSLDAPADASGSALEDFLRDKRGYCVQFSGAMTAMARSLGIPARIGVGFTAGTPTGEGSYDVRLNQAHAWPELYFEGSGWVRFEPTPGGPAGDPPPWAEAEGGDQGESEETESPTDAPSDEESEAAEESPPAETPAPEAADDEEQTSASSSAWPAVVGGVVLLVLLLALPAVVRLFRRRSRLTGDAAHRAEGIWEEIAATTIDGGLSWDHSRTLRDHEQRLSSALEEDDAALLTRAADAAESLRYGGGVDAAAVPSTPEAAHLVARIRAAQAEELSIGARLRAAVLPLSLFRGVPRGREVARKRTTGATGSPTKA